MKYTLLAIIVACVVIFIASGCAVYYPTSYRAFIPRILDSEYKEYQRLCKEEIGKVVYARPISNIESVDDQTFMWFLPNRRIVPQVLTITDLKSEKVVYIKIIGFQYDTLWSAFYPELFIMPHSEKHYIYEGYDIHNITSHTNSIKQEINNNDSIVGEDFDDMQGFDSYDWYMSKILFGKS